MIRRVAVLLAVVALVAAACGSRVDEDEAAEHEQAEIGGGGETTPSDSRSEGSDGDSGSGDTVMFGTLESPCGPGDASTPTDQGVTEESIKIATIADPGGPVQGLNQGIHDSMEAFAAWCNEQGGINGRELDLTLLDAAVVKYGEVVQEACGRDFALVGGGGALDDLGAQEAVDCGLVDVAGFTVSALKAGADRMYQPIPNPVYQFNAGAGEWIRENYPDVIDRAASVWSNIPVGSYQQGRQREAYEKIGYEFVLEKAANVNEVNWGPLVTEMKNAAGGEGIRYLTFTSTYEELVNLQKAMRQQGMPPPCGAVEEGEDCVVHDLEANYYNQDYPKAAGEAAEGSFVRITSWPFEEADENPAMREYLDILEEYGPDDPKVELLGSQAFSAGLLFATAAKRAGDDLTRDRLMEELESIHEWDGGGLHGVNDPGNNTAGNCFIIMNVVDGGFERLYPDEGFSCPEDSRVELEGDYGQGAEESGAG